eukprot:6174023-Pleurochrysis_carterae.AAC.10
MTHWLTKPKDAPGKVPSAKLDVDKYLRLVPLDVGLEHADVSVDKVVNPDRRRLTAGGRHRSA